VIKTADSKPVSIVWCFVTSSNNRINKSNQLKKKKTLSEVGYLRQKYQKTTNYRELFKVTFDVNSQWLFYVPIPCDLWNDICDNFYPIFIVCVGLRQEANMDPREMQTMKKGKQVFLRARSCKKKHVDRSSCGRGQTTGESDQAR
jgi:hypothetical protein